jgi:chromosome partitioning protein
LANLQQIIVQAKDLNPNLKTYGLLTMASTNPVVQEVNEAREYLQDYPEIKLLTTIVRDRKVYRDAMSEGKGVIELDNIKAAGEIQSLVSEVFS